MRYKGFAAFLFVWLMFLTVTVSAANENDIKFPDVPKNHWAYESIVALASDGAVSGYPDGSFRPDAEVTRAEWSKMLCVAGRFKKDENFNKKIVDIKDSDWFSDYVYATAAYMPVLWDINGNITFLPEEKAVREGVTVSLVGAMDYIVEACQPESVLEFSDADKINPMYVAHIATAIEKGLVKGFGDGTYRPQDTLTRAEAAVLLHRAFYDENTFKLSAPEPEVLVNVEIIVKDYIEKLAVFDKKALLHISKDSFLYSLMEQTLNYEDTLNMIAQGSGMSGETLENYVATMLDVEKKVNKYSKIKVLDIKKDKDYVKVSAEKFYLDIADMVANTDYRRFLTDEEYDEMLLNSAIMSEEEYVDYMLDLYIKVMPRMYDALIGDAEISTKSCSYVLKKCDGKWLIVSEY